MADLKHTPMLCAGCGRPLAVGEKVSRICGWCSATQKIRRFILDLGIAW